MISRGVRKLIERVKRVLWGWLQWSKNELDSDQVGEDLMDKTPKVDLIKSKGEWAVIVWD